jgi:hypothetical protein
MKMTKLLTTFLIILVVLFAGCKKDDYVEKIGVCFRVIATDPIDAARSVPYNKVVSATFSAKADASTIDESTFTLQQGTTSISGTVSYTDSTATFTPDVALLPLTEYTGTIKSTVTSTWGNGMQADHVWKFTTMPQVSILSEPIIGGTTSGSGAFAEGAIVTVTATPLPGYVFVNWTENGAFVSLSPSLKPNGLKAANGATEISASSNYTFTMGAANRTLTANFSMKSIYTLNVTALHGTVEKYPNQTTFEDGVSVALTATPAFGYTFSSWSGDASGSVNPLNVTMNANKVITANFILAGAGAGPGNLDLGGAAFYTVLSKTGISTTGITSITGNIGVSPNSATGITGFGLIMDPSNQFSKSSPSTLVSGNVYAADYAVPTPANISTAISDMETAFTTGNGKTLSVITELGAGDITGMTLAPGLYKWGTGLLISASGVTLSGSTNDTWIFQIGQGMTVADGANIILAGGAQAKNIYWITASDAVIGSTVHFKGNILSQTLVSVNTGSTVTGRLLGQTAVTLNAATVILP